VGDGGGGGGGADGALGATGLGEVSDGQPLPSRDGGRTRSAGGSRRQREMAEGEGEGDRVSAGRGLAAPGAASAGDDGDGVGGSGAGKGGGEQAPDPRGEAAGAGSRPLVGAGASEDGTAPSHKRGRGESTAGTVREDERARKRQRHRHHCGSGSSGNEAAEGTADGNRAGGNASSTDGSDVDATFNVGGDSERDNNVWERRHRHGFGPGGRCGRDASAASGLAGSGSLSALVHPDVPEPYEDSPPPIPNFLLPLVGLIRKQLEGSGGAATMPVPAFAVLVAQSHHAREFLGHSVWHDADVAASRYMAAYGRAGRVTAAVQQSWALDPVTGLSATARAHRSGAAAADVGDNEDPAVDPAEQNGARAAATLLHERGWVVLPHVSRADVDGVIVAGSLAFGQDIHAVLSHFVGLFPGEGSVAKQHAGQVEKDKVWTSIHNRVNMAKDSAQLAKGQGRMTVLNEAVKPSDDAGEQGVYEAKLRADLFCAAVAHKILSVVGGRTESNQLCIQMPKAGACMLLTTDKARPQRPHVDSDPLAVPRTTAAPSSAGALGHATTVTLGDASGGAAAAADAAASAARSAPSGVDDDDTISLLMPPTQPLFPPPPPPSTPPMVPPPAPTSTDKADLADASASGAAAAAAALAEPTPAAPATVSTTAPPPLSSSSSLAAPLPVYAATASLNYFLLATGADGAILRVWPDSARVLRHLQQGDATRRIVRPELVYLPPFSFVLLRGDVVHAGAGAADNVTRLAAGPQATGMRYSRCIRLHMYLQDKGVPLANAIHLALPEHVIVE